MPHSSSPLPPFRFVWRRTDSRRWYTSTVRAAHAAAAIAVFHQHLEQTVKLALDAAVVDHFFYPGSVKDPTQELQVLSYDPLSLRDFEHPFHYEYANRVYAPPSPALAA